MEHKAGKRKAIKFFEDNFIMIHSIQSSNEQGCAAKCLELLKTCDAESSRMCAEYKKLEEEFIAHTGMNFKDWLKHTTSMSDEFRSVEN